ncbi:MAG: alanine dehydrogenase [Bacteroidales bacterium]|nr:alanine dehydrogenase [Bacteroidales bacterium]
MNEGSNDILKYGTGSKMLPREEMLEVSKHHQSLSIGIPKEITYQEHRIALVPDAIGLLVANGHQVLIESGAGAGASFNDKDFAEYGGKIVYSSNEVYKANIILKVAPASLPEIDKLDSRQTIISSLNLTEDKEKYFKKLVSKKMTAIGFEYIKDKVGSFPVIRAMSEIAGNTSIFIASEYLSNSRYGRGIMLGGFPGINPTEIMIIGAGTVGEYAARVALGMGALVRVFDNSLYKLRRLQNTLGMRLYTSVLQPKELLRCMKTADVLIGAMHAHEGRTPCIISEDYVQQMKEGSVIIDVSIDQGGCIETSRVTDHKNPVFQKHGVTHYCVPNIPSRVPYTASYALSNFFAPVLLRIGQEGGVASMLKSDFGMRNGVYIFNGISTKRYISEYYKVPFQDIDLLMAAFH